MRRGRSAIPASPKGRDPAAPRALTQISRSRSRTGVGLLHDLVHRIGGGGVSGLAGYNGPALLERSASRSSSIGSPSAFRVHSAQETAHDTGLANCAITRFRVRDNETAALPNQLGYAKCRKGRVASFNSFRDVLFSLQIVRIVRALEIDGTLRPSSPFLWVCGL